MRRLVGGGSRRRLQQRGIDHMEQQGSPDGGYPPSPMGVTTTDEAADQAALALTLALALAPTLALTLTLALAPRTSPLAPSPYPLTRRLTTRCSTVRRSRYRRRHAASPRAPSSYEHLMRPARRSAARRSLAASQGIAG